MVDYRISFADQGNQASVFRFRFQQTSGSLPFPFSIYSKQTEVAVFRLRNSRDMEMENREWGDGEQRMETWRNGDIKWKTENRSPGDFLNPFAHRANGSFLFVR